MIVGVGTDIVSIPRFTATLARTPSVRGRVFTDIEADLPVESLAARFAAKEAVAKALFRPAGMRWRHAWIERAVDGRPILHVEGYEHLAWHVTLAHEREFAVAFVVAEACSAPGDA